MNDVLKQKEHFENVSERYFKSRQNGNHLQFKKLLWDFFFSGKEYFKTEKISVLEPMCGYAEGKKILEECLEINIQYDGFDYSEVLVNIVNEKNNDINISLCDITTWKATKKYDLIIVIGGLHHIPNHVSDVMQNLSNALNANGFFIAFEPTHNNFAYKKIRECIYKKNDLFDSATEQAFVLNDLNNLFIKTGFKIVDQIYPGLLSYILYYNPDAFPILNIGNEKMVKLLFNFDKIFFKNIIGKKFSFATLTLLQKC